MQMQSLHLRQLHVRDPESGLRLWPELQVRPRLQVRRGALMLMPVLIRRRPRAVGGQAWTDRRSSASISDRWQGSEQEPGVGWRRGLDYDERFRLPFRSPDRSRLREVPIDAIVERRQAASREWHEARPGAQDAAGGHVETPQSPRFAGRGSR